MELKKESHQTFVDVVLAILEGRLPWLGSRQDEPVSGEEIVDQLNDLYQSLVHERDRKERKESDSES